MRKPLSEKTIVENVLKWRVGGINIDECRIKYEEGGNLASNPSLRDFVKGGNGGHIISTEEESRRMTPHNKGRWPANIILSHSPDCKQVGYKTVKSNGHYVNVDVGDRGIYGDVGAGDVVGKTKGAVDKGHIKQEIVEQWECSEDCPFDLFEAFGNNKGQQADIKGTEPSRKTSNCYGEYKRQGKFKKRNDTGSAARFFYCAKASSKERGKGNTHPTVKPLALLRYLIKLITPKGGVILDPFIGSGSTAIAAQELGFNWIGVEKDEDSYCIAKKRIKNHFIV